jgi:hypothetical protein
VNDESLGNPENDEGFSQSELGSNVM